MADSRYDIVGWRAWYAGGRKFDSGTTCWEDLPAEGVLIFVLYQRERRRCRRMLGVTLYWKDSDIYACDDTNDANIREDLPANCVKRGKWVTDGEMGLAQEEARAAIEAPDESQRI